MGNLYRFVEPVLLFLLKKKGRSHGYELASELRTYALTDAEIEGAALYRTLRQLEESGCVTSEWNVEGSGPARRIYSLTARGVEHLEEWVSVLESLSGSISRFVEGAKSEFKLDGASQRRRNWLARSARTMPAVVGGSGGRE